MIEILEKLYLEKLDLKAGNGFYLDIYDIEKNGKKHKGRIFISSYTHGEVQIYIHHPKLIKIEIDQDKKE